MADIVVLAPPLRLVALTAPVLEAMAAGDHPGAGQLGGFVVPEGWPDGGDNDRGHVRRWLARARRWPDAVEWMARAIVDDAGRMVGHAGFHLPPAPLPSALGDPTFSGSIEPGGLAVEIGYTVFAPYRRRGIAAGAAGALVDWAFESPDVSVVLATVAPGNEASLRVLERVGGFRAIGDCSGDDGPEIVFRRDRSAE